MNTDNTTHQIDLATTERWKRRALAAEAALANSVPKTEYETALYDTNQHVFGLRDRLQKAEAKLAATEPTS